MTPPKPARPLTDKTTWLKWIASVVQIFGYAATGFGFVPLNAYLFIAGLIGWFAVGVLWRDKAIMLIHAVAFVSLTSGLISK